MPGANAHRPRTSHRDDDRCVDLVLVGHVGWATNANAQRHRRFPGRIRLRGRASPRPPLLARAYRPGRPGRPGPQISTALRRSRPRPHRAGGPARRPRPGSASPATATEHAGLPVRTGSGGRPPASAPFPEPYFRARHVHLGTMPPGQQLTWLKFLRDHGFRAPISVDTFEHFVRTEPSASREACDLADLIFINEAEYRGLYRENEIPKAPTILQARTSRRGLTWRTA